ncbi:MFS transporter [Acidithiobacillus sp. M4-SHS-6]|uniref:MFS transporter n=1 Tax=Acidithiobacillus sp. M4-SHS-6 TaxID=3383024 RepID=UPI0039BE5472
MTSLIVANANDDRLRVASVERMVLARAISSVGSRLTTFGLDIWVYNVTHSYWAFVLLAFLVTMTTLVVSLRAGVIVDSAHKGRVIFLVEASSMAVVLASLIVLLDNQLTIDFICIMVVLLTIADVFRWSSLQAIIAVLVPRAQLGRISGMMESYRSATIIVGPLLGAIALVSIGLKGILICDLVTFVVSIWLLRRLLYQDALGIDADKAHRHDATSSAAVYWLRNRPALLKLLGFYAFINGGFAVVSTVQSPFILYRESPTILSIAITSMGVGTLCGGRIFSRFANRLCLEASILFGIIVESTAMVFLGASTQASTILMCMFVMGISAAVAASANQMMWQLNVPNQLQGRIMAIRMLVAQSTPLLGLLVTVPLQSRIFKPLIDGHSGTIDSWMNLIWGHQADSSVGLMMSCLAALILITTSAVLVAGGLGLKRVLSE